MRGIYQPSSSFQDPDLQKYKARDNITKVYPLINSNNPTFNRSKQIPLNDNNPNWKIPQPLSKKVCFKHPKENVRFYCLDCNENNLCGECVISNIHQQHNVLNEDMAAQTIKFNLEKSFNFLANKKKNFNDNFNSCNERRKLLQQNFIESKKILHKIFEEMRFALNQKENEMMYKAEDEIKKSLIRVDDLEKELSENYKSLSNNLNLIQSNLGNKTKEEMLNFYSENNLFIKDTLESFKRNPIDYNDDSQGIDYYFNKTELNEISLRQSEILRQISSIEIKLDKKFDPNSNSTNQDYLFKIK